jgi:hypothetical protein
MELTIRSLVQALEGSAANTDTDWRWRAANALRGHPQWESATLTLATPPNAALEVLMELANAADAVGVAHFDTDTMSDEVMRMQKATQAARSLLSSGGETRECRIELTSSRMCERGTKSCVVKHQPTADAQESTATPTNADAHADMVWVPRAYVEFYNEVAACFGDTWQCRCGHAEDWWTESNAEYATRNAVRVIEGYPAQPRHPGEPPEYFLDRDEHLA